jgi:hypothetical protein
MNSIAWNNLEVKADVFYVWSFHTLITGKGIGFIDFESVKFVSGVGFHSNPEFYLVFKPRKPGQYSSLRFSVRFLLADTSGPDGIRTRDLGLDRAAC